MKYHLTHRLTMRADFWLVLAGALLSFSRIHAQECTSLKGIASNHAVLLSGSSDTLWTLTREEPDRYAINTVTGDGNLTAKITDESKWNALYLCKTPDVHSMSYGAGILVVLHDTLKNNFSTFSRAADGSIRRKAHSFPWSARVMQNDSIIQISAVSVTNDGKRFFFACQNGGVVQWDPVLDKMSMFLPEQAEKPLESLRSDTASPDKKVNAVSVIKDGLLVTTPEKVWKYSFSDSSWDSSITASLNESSYTLKRFVSVFSRNDSLRSSLYGLINVSGSVNEEDSIILCKYDTASSTWQVLMDNGPQVISFGHGGVVYTVSGKNKIEAFLDTLVSSVSERNPRALVGNAVFQDSMIRSFSIEYPEYVNDIVYSPVTDSTGNLWIATSGGLFFSEGVSPADIIRSCRIVKRAPSLASGLEKTYARPGILRSGIYDSKASRTVFVYNLSKDAKVTIRIYDYNMDHVKTVISGKFRKAGKNGGPMGRSTVEAEDSWDGRNENGKMVAPGVYYYKITADSGERAFGKCVVAK